MRKIICILLFALPLMASKADVLHKTRVKKITEAINCYREYRKEIGREDFELLQQMAVGILDQGFRSKEPQEQFLATFGAGTARSARFLYILESGMKNPDPKIQLASLYFLSDLRDDDADNSIKGAMSSDYLPIRLEAAKILASRRETNATSRIEGLMCKLDPLFHPLFPPLFAISSDKHATSILKKCCVDRNDKVRLSTILACIDFKRDDLLPQIRTLAACGNMEEQEAAAFALGVLKDSLSISQLKLLTNSPYPNVRLSALISLYRLGYLAAEIPIKALAKRGDLFAIKALEDTELLSALCCSPNLGIRFNAGLALLEQKDARCLPVLEEILIKDSRDLSLVEQTSPGYVLTSWKVIPSISGRIEPESAEGEVLLNIKQAIIESALNLPRENFYTLASILLDNKDPELVPILINCIESLHDEESVKFLKKELQRAGAPLVRAYCNLALYRLKEEGPYAQFVRQWVKDLGHIDLINFRPVMPRTRGHTVYSLTPQETCRLFVDAVTALANEKDPESLDAILTAISLGHPSNRFVLAGLLIRATE